MVPYISSTTTRSRGPLYHLQMETVSEESGEEFPVRHQYSSESSSLVVYRPPVLARPPPSPTEPSGGWSVRLHSSLGERREWRQQAAGLSPSVESLQNSDEDEGGAGESGGGAYAIIPYRRSSSSS